MEMWQLDEKWGVGISGILIVLFSLQNHHQRISIVFRVLQEPFLFSLYYHISICFISSSPSSPPQHFHFFPSATTTSTTFQLFHDITL